MTKKKYKRYGPEFKLTVVWRRANTGEDMPVILKKLGE
jgi:hypothetical protein